MKKTLVLLASLMMTFSMYAQDPIGTLSLKPMAGMTIANFIGSDAEGTDTKLGAIFGGELIYQANSYLALSAGLLYSMQGCSADGEGDPKMSLDYINLPVLANFYVFKGFALKAGLQLGYLTKAKVSGSGDGIKAEVDMKDACNDFDLSIPIGVSYDINNSFVIEGRYNVGITKVPKSKYSFMGESYHDDDTDARNSVFQITLGYKFALK